jgi:abequosyltransferase
MNNKLLSICIPTYNRAEVLEVTLNSLFSNPEFDENKIEVIVSDNCSTDNTAEVVGKYPLARYYCNSENVKDCNFSIVLDYATGSYIRLFNDTISFKEGALQRMLGSIERHLGEDCNLFFYRNEFLNKNCKVITNTKKDFIREVSLYSTWIANFGAWREDFEKIKNKNRYADLQFVQVDWSYRILDFKKESVIYFDDLIIVAVPNKKGGYNIFDTFVNKYLYIIKKEKFDFLTYEIEKYRLCRYFIYPNLLMLLIYEKDKYDFEIDRPIKLIFKKYWYEPYFYPMVLSLWFKMIKNLI